MYPRARLASCILRHRPPQEEEDDPSIEAAAAPLHDAVGEAIEPFVQNLPHVPFRRLTIDDVRDWMIRYNLTPSDMPTLDYTIDRP